MKYKVNSWVHAHYISEVEANSFEEAKKLCECGCDTTDVNFDGFDIGDEGISCITDENGNEYWCE
jgi:hypothetical protein